MKKVRMTIVIAAALLGIAGFLIAAPSTSWNYDLKSNHGPVHWGKAYPDCQEGSFQSPIDIDPMDVIARDTQSIQMGLSALTGRMADDGRSILLYPISNFLTFEGASYLPVQFHFHSAAETLLNGKRAALELHWVTKNKQGQYLVLAVLIEPGKANKGLARVLRNSAQKDMQFTQGDIVGLFPPYLKYYRFEGSLTTPPCAHGITWVVFAHPITASQAQIRQVQEEFQGGKTNYFRPIQPTNHRPIWQGMAIR